MSEFLYLSRHDVEAAGVTMSEIIELVGFALGEHGHGRTQMPPKPGVHPLPDSLLHAMPAYVERSQACGIKWVSSFPQNKLRGLPRVSGFIVLNDCTTGLPQAILDATWITAMRTAASSAVAARVLAPQDSEIMGLLGTGVQGRTNVAALKEILPRLRLVRAYGPRRETVEQFKKEIEKQHGLQVELASSPEAAVRDCDVLVTAAPWPGSSPPIQPPWLAPGLFACALDFDASFTTAAVNSFDRRLSDDVSTFNYYQQKGSFPGWEKFEELSAVIAGKAPGRKNNKEKILAANLGLGIYDVVVAKRVVERARERSLGTMLPA